MMGAEDLGEKLLGEVEEESLDKLLQTLRYLDDPQPESRLGIPVLDNLLNILQYPRQQRQQQPWTSPQRGGGTQAPPAPLRPQNKPPVIELTSTSPCSGATQLLYYITAVSILPAALDGVALHGKEGAVVILDNLGTFDVQRLYQITLHYIQSRMRTTAEAETPLSSEKLDDADIDALIASSLQHVHVFRPQSSASFLATLQSLPSYLLSSLTAHFSGTRALQAILIDGISAFVWQDRAEANLKSDAREAQLDESVDPDPNLDSNRPHPNSRINNNNNNINPLINHYTTLTTTLRSLQTLFSCPIVATTWGLLPVPASTAHITTTLPPTTPTRTTTFRPNLPAPWTNFCTLRLTVSQAAVPKFRESLSVRGAGREARARQEVLERGERVAVVNLDRFGSREGRGEGGEGEVGQAVRFWVRQEGVDVDGEVVRWRSG